MIKSDDALLKLALATAVLVLLMLSSLPSKQWGASPRHFIVQASSTESARHLVLQVRGKVERSLDIIDAVAAHLTPSQIDALQGDPAIKAVYADYALHSTGGKKANQTGEAPHSGAYFPEQVGADKLHDWGITGRGATIAFIGTGMWLTDDLIRNSKNQHRLLAHYDAINAVDLPTDNGGDNSDKHGHGSHIAAVAVNNRQDSNGGYLGIAPDADLVVVKAFDDRGRGRYIDVINAIDWVVANRNKHYIRVLNLSFGAPVRSHYWEDPLNQAVIKAWQAGIAVVTSAGNTGPDPMTIGVPGNVPYVITVGAITGGYTPTDPGDDRLTGFSSSGPTLDAFVKPDVITYGGHTKGYMQRSSTIADAHPDSLLNSHFDEMSGTSQAAALVSGTVALMLSDNAGLTPDDIKCRLMASAKAAVAADGQLAYSLFQQGAGQINAWDAVMSTRTDCANNGLDIDADLQGLTHFQGPVQIDANGDFFLHDSEGNTRIEANIWDEDSTWNEDFTWNESPAENPGINARVKQE